MFINLHLKIVKTSGHPYKHKFTKEKIAIFYLIKLDI